MLGIKNNLKRRKSRMSDSFSGVQNVSDLKKDFKVTIAERLLVQINSGENEILFI
ncbi:MULTISPECIES: hypothetical protein [Flavobacterium]|uniref:Uncharacterized protein n=1 Tax=Flavobacterium hankyongi TaxID=1176532 RepID=A0ABP8ZK29_9FLAO|nr:hypothetical protein [Flavobacterium sp. N1846]